MQMCHRILFFLFLLVASPIVTQPLFAQEENSSALIDEANSLYYNGEFLDCISLIKAHEHELTGQQKVTAYSLLSLSFLALDDMKASEQYAVLLLRQDPHYSVYNQNPRFRDMLERLKKGETTISTASQQKETIEEAPVPVTLISRQMIELSGARTLQDLLCLYVPGFSLVDGLEANLAMRGVFSQNQETVLIMIDGHRLNSQSSNTEAPDYRTSLDKIQQIEVLRGPASSLYGNAALTAVVNIITRRGSELDGHSVTLTGGSFKSVGGTYMFGKGSFSQDFLLWASVYNSKGQELKYPALYPKLFPDKDGKTDVGIEEIGVNKRYTGGYNHKPAFDLGLRFRWDDLTFMVTAQHSKRVPFFNQMSVGDTYEYDDYPDYRGSSPGNSRTQIMATVDYSHSWNRLSLNASAFGSFEDTQIFNVLADSIEHDLAAFLQMLVGGKGKEVNQALFNGGYAELKKMFEDSSTNAKGVWESMNWSSKTFGGSVQLGYNYEFPNGQKGNLLGGLQFEHFSCTEGSFLQGGDYERISSSLSEGIVKGDEYTASGFLQLKHNFSDKIIFNGGFRYDMKSRIYNESLHSFSPRVTLIYQPTKTFTTKLGYAHSFVDAPYIYRASNILFYKGVGLHSEEMDAIQLSFIKSWPQYHLRYEGNFFMNNVSNLVYMNPMNFVVEDPNAVGVMVNSGSINMLGTEHVFEYSTQHTLFNTNFTLQLPLSVKDYPMHDSYVCNVPKFLLNLTAARQIYEDKNYGTVWVRGNMHVQSCEYLLQSYIIASYSNAISAILQNKIISEYDTYPTQYQAAKCLLNIGADWKWRNLKVSLDCYNLFNTNYKVAGLLQASVPQPGRCIMGKVNVIF